MSRRTVDFTSKQSITGFVYDLCKAIENIENDLDISIILDSNNADYLYELLECSSELHLGVSDLEHDFGRLSGKCLITIFKKGSVIDMIVEDVCKFEDKDLVPKYHEADVQIVTRNDLELVQKYSINKCIVIDFESERKAIEALLLYK